MSKLRNSLKASLYKQERRANSGVWIIWSIEILTCLVIGAWLGWMYGRAF